MVGVDNGIKHGGSHIYLHSNDRYYMAIPRNTMTRYIQGVMCSGSDCRTACLLSDMMKGGTVCIMGSEPTAWLGDMSLTQWILVQLRYLSGHWRKSKQAKSKSNPCWPYCLWRLFREPSLAWEVKPRFYEEKKVNSNIKIKCDLIVKRSKIIEQWTTN